MALVVACFDNHTIPTTRRQHGVDLFATKSGKRHVAQCKQVGTFPPSRAKKEVEKLQGLRPDAKPGTYVLAATADLSIETQRAVKVGVAPGTTCEFWGPSTLDRLIRGHQSILDRFFPDPLHTPVPERHHNILPPAGDFTGRETELTQLLAAVDAKPGAMIAAGLQGMGGIGKTELARRIAQERWDAYPDAHLEIDLLGASPSPLSSAGALTQLIQDLEPQAQLPEDEPTLVRIFQSTLQDKRGILLLDNAASAEQVLPLLPPSGWLTLITSRFHFVVPGLEVLDLGPMPEEEARLFLAELSSRAVDVADDLLRLTGRLPLALRLAGSALATRTNLEPAAYVGRLEKVSGLVDGVVRTLAVSFDLFDPAQQVGWSNLAVFPGSFTASAAAAVWEMEEDGAEDALTDYISSSMVIFAGGRYRLHDLARVFARKHVTEPDVIHYRHAAFYVAALASFKERYKAGHDGVLEGLRGFDLERRNIEGARTWLCETGRDEAARRLLVESTNAGVYILDLRLHPSDWIAWLDEALRAARSIEDKAAEGRLLGHLGTVYSDLGDARKAIEHYEQQLAIAQESGDRCGEGAALGNLGTAYAALGDARKGIEHYEQDFAIAREIGDRRGEGQVLGNLGNVYAALGDARKGIEHYEQALAIALEVGDRRGEGQALGNLGLACAALGDARKGIEHYEQALAIALEVGDRRGEGQALGNLGTAYAALGDARKAIEHYDRRIAIAREIGDRRGEAFASWNMAFLLEKEDDLERAIGLAQVSVDYHRELGHPTTDARAERVADMRARLLSGE